MHIRLSNIYNHIIYIYIISLTHIYYIIQKILYIYTHIIYNIYCTNVYIYIYIHNTPPNCLFLALYIFIYKDGHCK